MIKLFTHDDTDGVGCAVLAKLAFGDNVSVEYCDHHHINDAVAAHFNKNTTDEVHIADISLNDSIACQIDASDRKYRLFDHHPTAMHLSKYSWCDIRIENYNGLKTSGTEIYYNWLLGKGYIDRNDTLDRFVQIIRDYDTWRWAELGEEGLVSKQVNDLFYIYQDLYGIDAFVNWALHCIEYSDFPHFYDGEKLMLLMKQKEIDAYVEEKDKQMVVSKLLGFSCGYVFADKHFSELGNKLCLRHPEIDIVAMIDAGKRSVSYRTAKECVDLGAIAKRYGGGGHPKAAGSSYSTEIQQSMIKSLFVRSRNIGG